MAGMPAWFVNYKKQMIYFPLKIRSFTYGSKLGLIEIEDHLSSETIK